MSTKAVVGRALRETGAALKQASGAEVRLLLAVMVVVVCGYILARRPERAVWSPKVYVLFGTDDEYVVLTPSRFRLVREGINLLRSILFDLF